MSWLCHPWLTTTNPSYRFPMLETSAAALCGTTGKILRTHSIAFYILYRFGSSNIWRVQTSKRTELVTEDFRCKRWPISTLQDKILFLVQAAFYGRMPKGLGMNRHIVIASALHRCFPHRPIAAVPELTAGALPFHSTTGYPFNLTGAEEIFERGVRFEFMTSKLQRTRIVVIQYHR